MKKKKRNITKPEMNKRDEIKFKDSQKKLKEIIRKMNISTLEKRIKIRLVEEYSKGRFFDIPIGLFNMNERFDAVAMRNLKTLFECNSKIPSFIPANLYDWCSNSSDRNRLMSFLKEKNVRMYIGEREINLNSVPLTTYSLFEKITLVERNAENYLFNNYARNTSIQITENIRKVKLSAEMSQKEGSLEDKVIDGVYESQLYIYLLEAYRGVISISGKRIEDVLPKLEELEKLDELYVGNRASIQKMFLSKRDEVMQNIGNTAENFSNSDLENSDNSKELLIDRKINIFKILEILKECGALTDLIEKENDLIRYLNYYLTEESKLEEFDEKDLMKEIESMDVTKLEDLIFLLLHNRHFANKLAHVYDDYMFTNVFVNSLKSKDIFGDKENAILGIKDRNIINEFQFIDEFMKQNFNSMSEGDKKNINEEFVERILKLRKNYMFDKAFQEDGEENVLRRMKIALILNPNEKEIETYTTLKDAKERLTDQEIKLLVSQMGSKAELDGIFSKIFGTEEESILKYLKNSKYKKKQGEIVSLKDDAISLANDIIENKEAVEIGNSIIRDIAKEKGIDTDNNYHTRADIYVTMALYGLTKEYVQKELWKLMENALNKLPESVRKWPPKHNQLEEECKKAGLTPNEIFLVKNKFTNESEAENFLNEMNKKYEDLSKLKQEVIDWCEKPMLKDYDDKAKYCKVRTDQFKKILDDYYDLMTREVEYGVRKDFPSAFDAISALLENEADSREFYVPEDPVKKKLAEDLKYVKIEREFAQVSFVELVKEFESDVKKDRVINNIYDVFTTMAQQVDFDKKLYYAKHRATADLLHIASENPDMICIEGELPTEHSNGLINILMSGVYQKNSCHNKFAELNELSEYTGDMFQEPQEHAEYYKLENQIRYPLNTYIYQATMSLFQRKGFQRTAKMIASIDGIYNLDEGELNEEENSILEKLNDLKTNNPKQYEAIKPRFMLGAGVEYYKSYYQITNRAFSDVVNEEENILNAMLESIVVKSEDGNPNFDVAEFSRSLKNSFFADDAWKEINKLTRKIKIKKNDRKEK